MSEAARLVRAERATLYLLNQAAGEVISYIAQDAEGPPDQVTGGPRHRRARRRYWTGGKSA